MCSTCAVLNNMLLSSLLQITEEDNGLDSNKSAGLGKKMKAISLTMRKRLGKKHAKSLSEEMVSLTHAHSYKEYNL